MERIAHTKLINEDLQDKYFNYYNEVAKVVFNSAVLNKIANMQPQKRKTEMSRLYTDFIKESNRCAYSTRYSILDSFSVEEHFRKACKSSSSPIKDFLMTGSIQVCCFGGGPATEMVGICKVISDLIEETPELADRQPLKLCFTIVDACKGWQKWAASLAKVLRKCDHLCNPTKVDVNLKFVQADLTKPWDYEVLKPLKECQILTMVRFVSEIISNDEERGTQKVVSLLSDVIQNIGSNTWIFYLDVAGGNFYHTVRKEMTTRGLYHDYSISQSHAVDIKMCPKNFFSRNPIIDRMMLGPRSTTVMSGNWLKRSPKPSARKEDEVAKEKRAGKNENHQDVK